MAYNDSKGGRPPKSVTLMTPEKVKMAIKSTQSMGQAALYMGVSKNTFKKYAKQYGVWSPKKSSKGIRRSFTGNFSHDLQKILEGKNPNPYREDTLLTKAIKDGYMKCQCSNCSADFSHMTTQPPLILDFLDKDTNNTTIDNLRALCFNCIYVLSIGNKGWYRHRESPIGRALDDSTPNTEIKEPISVPKDEEVEYIPFEDFQKLL
tara:strand:- start:63 stop:680 length:618 start_codon:yes stop_codon:yes gene_type:complete